MKSVLTILISLLLSSGIAVAAEQALIEPLPTLVETALANNPELKSSRARWQMYVAKARQSSSFEDPMLMFKLQNLLVREPLSFGGKDPNTAKVVGISQQLPFWGKRSLREEVAGHEAEAYRFSIEERKLELRWMVKETYYKLYAVDNSLAIVAKNLRIMQDFTTVAESRYAVGQGAQTDILKAGLERSKLLDMQISLQQQRKGLEAGLNYLLSRPTDTPVGQVTDFELPRLGLSAAQLKELAEQQRPQLRVLNSQINKSRASHRLARKELWPDFNLSVEYMFRQAAMTDPGYDMFTVGLTFNLPIQRERRAAMIAESNSEATMSTEEIHSLKNNIDYTINDSLSQLERRQRLVELYQGGIIPQAEQTLESSLINYRVGKVDFLSVLDSRVSLFNYERELYESKAEYMMQLARLEAAVGSDLTAQQK